MKETYIRNIIFGIADSLVSTVGLLSGLGATGAAPRAIISTGIIYAFVEAFSMAVGSFLSERSAEEYTAQGETKDSRAFLGGAVMFISFILVSFIPIAPYIFLSPSIALFASVGFSLLALFIAGFFTAYVSKIPVFSHALSTALVGGAAIVIGVVVGIFMPAA